MVLCCALKLDSNGAANKAYLCLLKLSWTLCFSNCPVKVQHQDSRATANRSLSAGSRRALTE